MRIIEDSPTRLVLRHSWWADLRFALGVSLFSLCMIAAAVLLIGNPIWWHIPELNYSHGHKQPAVVATITGCIVAILGASFLAVALVAGLRMRTREYAFDAAAGTFSARTRRPFSPGSDVSFPLGAIARIDVEGVSVEGGSGSWWVLVQLAEVGPLILPRLPSLRAMLGAVKDSSALRASLVHGYMLHPGWGRERTEQLAAKLRQLLEPPAAQPPMAGRSSEARGPVVTASARTCPSCRQGDMVMGASAAYVRRCAGRSGAEEERWWMAPIFQQGAGQQIAQVDDQLLPPTKPEGLGELVAWSVLGGLGVWFFIMVAMLPASGGALPLSPEVVLAPVLLAFGLVIRMLGHSAYPGELWAYIIARRKWKRTWYCSRCGLVFRLPRSN